MTPNEHRIKAEELLEGGGPRSDKEWPKWSIAISNRALAHAILSHHKDEEK